MYWQLPTEAFLSQFVQDIFTILSLLGFVLTAFGVFFAWTQFKQTATATEAAIQSLKESQISYDKFIIGEASRLLTETQIFVKNENWSLAAFRLADLAHILNHLTDNDSTWEERVKGIIQTRHSFEKLEKAGKNISNSMRGKWLKLERDLHSEFSTVLKPFTSEQGEDV